MSGIERCDYRSVAGGADAATTTWQQTVSCPACGAEISLPSHVAAQPCAFCTTPLVIAAAHAQRLLPPQALLPFRVTAATAGENFRAWLRGLWFAPSRLKDVARQEGALQGIYLPYWSYDCDTWSEYRGERGDDRQVVSTDASGKRQTRTVTDWRPVSGQVGCRFDAVLARGSPSLSEEHGVALEPWDLDQMVPYQAHYLSGFAAEAYRVGVEEGFTEAQRRMQGTIESAVRSQIGGDHQRIHDLQTRYDDIGFKHLLLPLWISAYRFDGKLFRFLVNARTGEVQGERPWSAWKIAGAVLVILLLVGAFLLWQQ